MSRLIDADSLKRKVQKEATESWKMKIKASVETILNQVIDWIDEAQTVEPEQQWIPVAVRLPNREEYIQCNGLFIVSDGDRTYAEYFDIYDKKCFGEPVMHGFRADRAVTAWMPLPESYRGKQDGK